MIDPAVTGTKNLLEAAQKLGGSLLKRVVITGSAVSVSNYFQPDGKANKPYTEADWNEVTAEYAIEKQDSFAAYTVSKKQAEQAAWKYMADHKPNFDLAVLNPYIIIGPMLQPLGGPEHVTITNALPVYNFINGTYKSIEGLFFPGWYFVDVRDVARAHILSMTTQAASNKRILLVSGMITPQVIINIIRKNFPELHDRIIKGIPEKLTPDGIDPTGWDVSRSLKIFGKNWQYIGLEKTVTDTVKDLLNHEKRWSITAERA